MGRQVHWCTELLRMVLLRKIADSCSYAQMMALKTAVSRSRPSHMWGSQAIEQPTDYQMQLGIPPSAKPNV